MHIRPRACVAVVGTITTPARAIVQQEIGSKVDLDLAQKRPFCGKNPGMELERAAHDPLHYVMGQDESWDRIAMSG